MADYKHIEIKMIAQLVRVQLTESQEQKFGEQLEEIMGYIDRLKAVDVTGIEPAAHAFDIHNVWGADRVHSSFSRREVLENAPAEEDGQFVVPKVVEDA